uniref:Transmembrane protein n=1 Tax=Anopheles farauti TaxID=69004 RepID=A0A182QN56_9DIPT
MYTAPAVDSVAADGLNQRPKSPAAVFRLMSNLSVRLSRLLAVVVVKSTNDSSSHYPWTNPAEIVPTLDRWAGGVDEALATALRARFVRKVVAVVMVDHNLPSTLWTLVAHAGQLPDADLKVWRNLAFVVVVVVMLVVVVLVFADELAANDDFFLLRLVR